MHSRDYLTQSVIQIVENVSEFIAYHFGKVKFHQVQKKSQNSLVSFVDEEAEHKLVLALSRLIPGSGFITEESTPNAPDSKYVWVIDPLDGTTNFLYNIPHFSTSIALLEDGEPVLGVVGDIMNNQIYSAYKGNGTFRNQDMVRVSTTNIFSEAIIATGFPYTEYDPKPYLDMMSFIMKQARAIRRFGSAALDLAYVADGKFNAFYESSLNPWDVAGGIVLVQEAKGVNKTFFKDDSKILSGKSIISGNAYMVDFLQEATNQIFDSRNISPE